MGAASAAMLLCVLGVLLSACTERTGGGDLDDSTPDSTGHEEGSTPSVDSEEQEMERTEQPDETSGADPTFGYLQISAKEAKRLMDTEQNYVILDVRTAGEYNEGHIPGAIVIPDDEILARAPSELPDRDQLILVYCRSGRRSKIAAARLCELGYTNVKEFGGILDWPYEVTQ